MQRRHLGVCVFSLLRNVLFGTTAILAIPAMADGYPNKPITLVLATAPGGSSDTLARLVADAMQKALGQPTVVVSRPGGGGAIGVESVVRAPADGYTFVLSSSGNVPINPHILKLKYDPVEQLTHVSVLVDVPFVLVTNNDLAARDIQDFIRHARAYPKEVRMGNSGLGSHQHLTQVMFAKVAGIDLNIIPYKGSGPATTDLVGGHIESVIDNVGAQKSFIESGRVTAMLVTSATRVPSLPRVPTAQELGIPFESVAWFGISAPKGTPDAIVRRVQTVIATALAEPENRTKLIGLGMTPVASTPEAAALRVRADAERYRKAVVELGVKAE